MEVTQKFNEETHLVWGHPTFNITPLILSEQEEFRPSDLPVRSVVFQAQASFVVRLTERGGFPNFCRVLRGIMFRNP